jgi:hypothetical protein
VTQWIWTSSTLRQPFWDSPSFNIQKPKDIALLIFEASSRKKWKAKQALQGGAWIAKAKLDANFSLNNFHDFMHLSVELSNV